MYTTVTFIQLYMYIYIAFCVYNYTTASNMYTYNVYKSNICKTTCIQLSIQRIKHVYNYNNHKEGIFM